MATYFATIIKQSLIWKNRAFTQLLENRQVQTKTCCTRQSHPGICMHEVGMCIKVAPMTSTSTDA